MSKRIQRIKQVLIDQLRMGRQIAVLVRSRNSGRIRIRYLSSSRSAKYSGLGSEQRATTCCWWKRSYMHNSESIVEAMFAYDETAGHKVIGVYHYGWRVDIPSAPKKKSKPAAKGSHAGRRGKK